MKPSELRALLEKASPLPWDRKNLVDLWGDEYSREFTLALVNRAELLIELWEGVEKLLKGQIYNDDLWQIVAKLEAS